MLAVVGHYTINKIQQHHTLLAMRELQDKHSGENMAEAVLEVLQDFNIYNKVGYFVMDNAPNNDTMSQCIADALNTDVMIISLTLLFKHSYLASKSMTMSNQRVISRLQLMNN